MKQTKKLISILLTLALIVGLLTAIPQVTNAAQLSAAPTGMAHWEEQIGDCMFIWDWETSSLTIRGKGAMPDYDDENNKAPWNDCPYSKLVIENGVTHIGSCAFSHNAELTEVIIGKSVESIGDYAFFDCEKLEEIYLPDSVTVLGEAVFKFCTSLKNVRLSEQLSEVGWRVLFHCPLLKAIMIPDSLHVFGEEAFGFMFNDESDVVPVDGFAIYCSDKAKVKQYANFYEIPCKPVSEFPLEPLTDPNSTFGYYTYQLLDDGTAEITGFNGSIEEVDIPSEIDGHTVTSIRDEAFKGCETIKKATFPSSVVRIGRLAFDDCTNLSAITVPSSVTYIGNSAFGDTAWFEEQPEGPIYLGKAFYRYKGECPGEYTVKNGTKCISGAAFFGQNKLKKFVCPDSVLVIGDNAFKCCFELETFIMGQSVQSLESHAIFWCDKLKEITVPASVTYIDQEWEALGYRIGEHGLDPV